MHKANSIFNGQSSEHVRNQHVLFVKNDANFTEARLHVVNLAGRATGRQAGRAVSVNCVRGEWPIRQSYECTDNRQIVIVVVINCAICLRHCWRVSRARLSASQLIIYEVPPLPTVYRRHATLCCH